MDNIHIQPYDKVLGDIIMSIFTQLGDNLTLKDRVYNEIKTAIINGELLQNEPLIETEIAKAMNISRAPIREALNKLIQEGFVVNIPRRGCKVAPITKKETIDMYEMRMLIEPFAIHKSIDKIPLDQILVVEKIIYDVMDNPKDFDLYIKSDRELHSLLYNYIPNAYMKNTILAIDEHTMRTRYSDLYIDLDIDAVLTTAKEHLNIIDALKERDSEKASKAIHDHIVNGQKRTLRAFTD